MKARALNIGARTQQVVAHHYDEQTPGKPLFLLIPGGLIAVAALGVIGFIAFETWLAEEMTEAKGEGLIALLAPVYIFGVFLFSYGYELYDMRAALKLTAIIVVITLAVVIIVAVLVLALGSLGKGGGSRSSSSSSSSSSNSSSSSSRGSGGGISLGAISIGSSSSSASTSDAAPPAPLTVECPYCHRTFLAEPSNFICPSCGGSASMKE